jgi:(p)ppGpp synthase/HD superfamily hydrolase
VLHHPLVQKAYACAATVHGGNVQLDGSKRLEHLEKTALAVSSLGLDAVAVAAALLHKVLDDSGLDDSTLRTFVGEEVTDLVAGVSKASRLCKMYTEHRDLQDEVGFVCCMQPQGATLHASVTVWNVHTAALNTYLTMYHTKLKLNLPKFPVALI